MPILVVGSVAFDTLTTPSGHRSKILAAAATYFSLAASFFTPVGVIGQDFLPEHEEVLAVMHKNSQIPSRHQSQTRNPLRQIPVKLQHAIRLTGTGEML